MIAVPSWMSSRSFVPTKVSTRRCFVTTRAQQQDAVTQGFREDEIVFKPMKEVHINQVLNSATMLPEDM
jgi:hypothetical protein